MRAQFGVFAHHVHSSAQQTPGGVHRLELGIDHGMNAPAQRGDEFEQTESVVLGIVSVS